MSYSSLTGSSTDQLSLKNVCSLISVLFSHVCLFRFGGGGVCLFSFVPLLFLGGGDVFVSF